MFQIVFPVAVSINGLDTLNRIRFNIGASAPTLLRKRGGDIRFPAIISTTSNRALRDYRSPVIESTAGIIFEVRAAR